MTQWVSVSRTDVIIQMPPATIFGPSINFAVLPGVDSVAPARFEPVERLPDWMHRTTQPHVDGF